MSDREAKASAPDQDMEGADDQPKEEGANVADVTTKLSAAALRDFREKDTSEMADRPPSAKRPGSAQRPSSAQRPPSGKGSPAAEGSPTQRPSSAARPGSATRPGSAARPGSATRPGSAERPGSATRPGSAARPGSTTQPGSAERPGSATRPGSAARPGSATRPGSAGRPKSGSGRASSAANRPASGEIERPASGTAGRPGTVDDKGAGRPASGGSRSRPGADDDDDLQEGDGMEEVEDNTYVPRASSHESGAPRWATSGGDLATTAYTTTTTDQYGDSEEEEEEEQGYSGEEDGEEGSEGSDDDNEMVVLDPDHPLMRRFQQALKAHLSKVQERVTLERSELKEAMKNKLKDREELGVNLYGLQQELARQQMLLEKQHDDMAKLVNFRKQCEEDLNEVRNMYKSTQNNVTKQRKDAGGLQTEVENLALHLFYMTNAKEDIRGDIAVMKRAAEKADAEVSEAELEKQRQDLYVDRLTETTDKLREQIALYEAQCSAQSEETKAAKDALGEARMEIESIQLEKKQLYQQWNSSLIGMRRRDEAHAAMNEALSQQKQGILSLRTEIEGYKKSIQKEQENNETLTILMNKNEADINTVKRLITNSGNKQEQIKQEYNTYSRMLNETEQSLNRATTDRTLRLNELNSLRKQIEQEFQRKLKLEEDIMETMRNKLTMDKASQYAQKMASKVRQRIAEAEAARATVENEISHDTLELSHTMTRVERLKKALGELDKDIHEKNDIISRSENEIIKRNAVIERKQGLIDQYNKRVEAVISEQGGEELGPLEQEVNALQKNIDTRTQDIADQQQFWLRQQSELVKMSKDKDGQHKEVDTMKKALTILHQKKMRIENDINSQFNEQTDVERNIRNMQNDMLKLNQLLNKEGKLKNGLQQDNVLMENDFVSGLKEAEMESLQMQNELEMLGEEKERLLNSLVEAERQIMLWEKKTQLAREAKATVDSEVGQGEIRAMTSEIHRMEVRYTQLMKLQEKLIQDMEKAVGRRDTIVTRGGAQAKLNKKVETKGTFQKKLVEMKKKIKQTQQDAATCDKDIHELRSHQQMLGQQLESKQTDFQHLQSAADTLDGDLERLMEIKQMNLNDIVAKQQKSKYYQALKDNRYTLLCKTESALETEMQKQTDRMHSIATIVDRLNQEFPHIQPATRRITAALSSRGVGEE